MSTAGSGPNSAVDAPAPKRPRRVKVMRWRGFFALAFGLAIVVLVWVALGNRIIKSILVEAATKSLGVEVDVGSLDLSVLTTSLEIRDVAVAHPFDSTRDVLEIRRLRVELEPQPLLEKKIVIRDIIVDTVRGLTHRRTPAKRIAAGGFLPGAVSEVTRWSAQFKVPVLSLLPIDTIRSLVLDPTQLQTVQQAKALVARADSVKGNAIARFKSLRLAETADSAEALLASLKGKTPRSLGINGTRAAVADVRRFVARVDSTKRSLDVVRAALRADVDSLTASVKTLDDAREADYAFARGLLKLPSFDAPNIGPALFGQVSIDAFQKVMYWVMLARDYAPPGLLPRESPGPKRLRRSGTTVHFVTPASQPQFLLRHAAVSVVLDTAAGAMRGDYSLRIADVTSDPAIVKRPTVFSLTRNSSGAAVESLFVVGSLDHTTARQTETIVVRAGGVSLPAFPVPSVPLRLDLAKGTSALRLDVHGDSVSGRLTVDSPHPVWRPDTARRRPMNTLESLVTRVLTGIPNVNLTADIRGTTKAPNLSIHSNLDRDVADNIKRVAGEEIAKAEAKVRAQVDAFVEKETAPVKAKVAEARAEVDQRVAEATTRLEKAKSDLAARLKELSGGLIGG